METAKLNVGWDLDGCLINTSDMFRAMLYNKYGTKDLKKTDAAGHERFKFEVEGVSDQKVWNVIHKVLDEYQEFCPPFVDSMYTLHRLYEVQQTPVHVITARPDSCADATREWLDTYIGVPYVLWVVDPPKNDKALATNVKTEDVNDLGLTHYIEDRFKYASQLAKECPNLEKVYLINKPYNVGRRTAEKVQRIDSALEILEDLKIEIE